MQTKESLAIYLKGLFLVLNNIAMYWPHKSKDISFLSASVRSVLA